MRGAVLLHAVFALLILAIGLRAVAELPSTASGGVTSPVTTSVPSTSSAMTSIRSFSLTKSTSETTRMASTRPICSVK